jgi:hypothetical protein
MSREVFKAIKAYDLKLVHTGSLSFVPNDRYLRATNCYDVDSLNKDLTEKKFVMVLNYANGDGSWDVYETPYLDFDTAKAIYQREHWRRIWDSSHLYYDDGIEVVNVHLKKE